MNTTNFHSSEANLDVMSPKPLNGTGLAPYIGPWGYDQAKHLLKRTMYGATKADISTLTKLSFSNAIAKVLSKPTGALTPAINNYFKANLNPDPNVAAGQPIGKALYSLNHELWRTTAVKNAWLHNMRNSPISIEQKLIYCWHNHLVIGMHPAFSGAKNIMYLETLRTHAFGNFKAMIKAITLDPAMLRYLNGELNTVIAPDENYGRELQELFCCGKGPNSKYTEDDVQEAARVLTGWKVIPSDYSVVHDPMNHDKGTKKFSAFYNNTVIQPGTGEQELDALLAMIFKVDEVALFVCRKLYRFFVTHEISAQTETDIIVPLANLFRSSNYEIRPVLEKLFNSEHFFDALNFSAQLKSPLDFIVGLSRECDIKLPDFNTQQADYFDITQFWIWHLESTQQDPGDPPNVAGHPAWYQEPSFDRLWISTDSYPKRIKMSDATCLYGIIGANGFVYKLDTLVLAKTFDNPSDPNVLVDEAVKRFLGLPISTTAHAKLLDALLTGQTDPNYWTNAWLAYLANPTDAVIKQTVESRLISFFIYLFRFEEYQLM
jgi:uncharacterized protein (DUF1800 family)